MSRTLSGTPVPRHQVFVLDDGDPVVQWSEAHVQEIYSGRVRTFDYSQFGHPITDYELKNLKSLGLVEHYTRQYVWVFALPEQSRFIGLRTIEGSSGQTRVFYLNTTLPESELDAVLGALDAADATETFAAAAYEGIVAVFGGDWTAYADIGEAEAAQRALAAIAPLCENAVIAFVDSSDARPVAEQAEPLDLDALIASQTPTPVTADKWAVAVSGSADERQQIIEALRVLQMQVHAVETGGAALRLLEDCAASDDSPALVIMDVRLPDMHSWELLSRLREIPTLDRLSIIALADDTADTADDDPTLTLTVAGVQVYLSRPLNYALLRQRVYETLKEKHNAGNPSKL